jgi:threonine/homoserine/homoserine lactone efflux protein
VARLGPTAKGVAAVLLNPGAWIFFATTASALIANATSDGGTGAALAAVVAMAIGVSCSDLTFTILGSGGRRLFGERGLRWIRMGLAALLVVIGVAFVTQAIRG